MPRVFIMEVDSVADVIDIIRRKKYRDTPVDKVILKDILFEATFLLSLYLELTYDDFNVLEDIEYYYEALEALDEIQLKRDWEILKRIPIEFIEVKNSRGLVIIHPEQPKHVSVRSFKFR